MHNISRTSIRILLSKRDVKCLIIIVNSFDKAAEERRQKRYEALLEQQVYLLQKVTRRLEAVEETNGISRSEKRFSHISTSDSGFHSQQDTVPPAQAAPNGV